MKIILFKCVLNEIYQNKIEGLMILKREMQFLTYYIRHNLYKIIGEIKDSNLPFIYMKIISNNSFEFTNLKNKKNNDEYKR